MARGRRNRYSVRRPLEQIISETERRIKDSQFSAPVIVRLLSRGVDINGLMAGMYRIAWESRSATR